MNQMTPNEYRFETQSGQEIIAELWLYPELELMGRFCDWDDHETGSEYFEALCNWNRKDNKEQWDKDAIDICWLVKGTLKNESAQIAEFAPFPSNVSKWSPNGNNFLTFFSWPIDSDGDALMWWKLPVRFSRFPDIDDYLRYMCGWIPAAGQETAPLRSIWDMHWAWYSALSGRSDEDGPIRVKQPGKRRGGNHFVFEDEYLKSFKNKKSNSNNKTSNFEYGKISNGDSGIHWKSVGEAFDWICHICGYETERKGGTHLIRHGCTVDHIVPQSKGGANTWNNVLPAHWECNIKKNANI